MTEESTTPDPVELVRRGIESFSNGDLDAVMSDYSPDAVVDASGWGIGVFEGRPAIRSAFEDWQSSYVDDLLTVEEVLDLGHGMVFTVYSEDARLVGSEGRVQQRVGWITVIVEGLIARTWHYRDIDEVRAAAERLAQERA